MITFAGAGRLAAEPAVAITFPDPGDDMAISDGLSFQVKAGNGATDLECSITQGSVSWKETESATSTACAPDRKAAMKFKPGPAKLSVRAKVGKAWTSPTTQAVKLVGDAPAAIDAECRGPKCAANRKPHDDARTATEAGRAVPSKTKVGDTKQPASWDGKYVATDHESISGFVRCPTSHNEGAIQNVEVSGGVVHFSVELKAEGEPLAPMTAKIGSDGKISGTATLSPANMAALAKTHPNNARYKLDRHKTFKITGTVFNIDALHKGVGHVEQGRAMKLDVDNKTFLTEASGASDSDGCEFEARAKDFHSSYDED